MFRFKLRYDLLILILMLLEAILLSKYFLRKINSNLFFNYEKWEGKNSGARIIYDQPIHEVLEEQTLKSRYYKIIPSFITAMAVLYITSLRISNFDRVFSMMMIYLVYLPIAQMLIFYNYAIFLGMGRRIYYQKGEIIIIGRYALSLKQPNNYRKSLTDITDISLEEKMRSGVCRYIFKLNARSIASSTNYDKIKRLQEETERLVRI